MGIFEDTKSKEYASIGFKNKRRSLRELPQRGTSNRVVDATKNALLPGKRVSPS